jgi:hypothetical protein
MVRLGGESGKYFGSPVLRLGGTWLFPLSSHKLIHIFYSTFLWLSVMIQINLQFVYFYE